MSKNPMSTEAQRDFFKLFQVCKGPRNAWETWQDFVTMSAIAISNRVDMNHEPEREKRYLEIVNKYNENERKHFPELFGSMVEALEKDPEQDFLGEMFMRLEMGDSWKGQVFTPYHVCEAMADITIDESATRQEVEAHGFVRLADPACGAGATMIAARNKLYKIGLGQHQAWFVCQDISYIAAMMCYVQLSLLGCAGYVCVGDTLRDPTISYDLLPITMPNQEIWMMPGAYTNIWAYRIMWRNAGRALKSWQTVAVTPPEPAPEKPKTKTRRKKQKDEQLSLFG